MSLAAVVFLSLIILTVTHVLDGALKQNGIKKSMFLLYMTVCFAISLTPVYNVNRYVSVHLLFAAAFISFAALLRFRRKTLLKAKEITFIFFTVLLYVLEMILGLFILVGTWYAYFKLAAVIAYCSFYIEKPQDSAICAGFGVWLLQLLLILRNMVLESYIYFDLSNTEVVKNSLLTALSAFIVSSAYKAIKSRRNNKKGNADSLELFTSSQKK